MNYYATWWGVLLFLTATTLGDNDYRSQSRGSRLYDVADARDQPHSTASPLPFSPSSSSSTLYSFAPMPQSGQPPSKPPERVAAGDSCENCERLLPRGEPKTRAVSERKPPSHPVSSTEEDTEGEEEEEGRRRVKGRRTIAKHARRASRGRHRSGKSLREEEVDKVVGLFERAVRKIRSLFQTSKSDRKEPQEQRGSTDETKDDATVKKTAKLARRKRPSHSQISSHESKIEADNQSESETEIDSGLEGNTESGSEEEEEFPMDKGSEEEEEEDAADTPGLAKEALPRFRERTKGHPLKKDEQGTGDSSSEEEHTIVAAARERDTPLGFLAQESYYPSFIPSEGCRALVDAIVANDATRLNQELAGATGIVFDMLCVQIILHTAIRNNRRYALWRLTNHLMEHLTPPMVKELEPVLLSEGIHAENAFAYWRHLLDSDEGRRVRLRRLLEGLSEHALVNFAPVWASSRYGGQVLRTVLPGLSERRRMLVQLVLKRRVRISSKIARTLTARTVNAIIDARRTFGTDLGFGGEGEDARMLLKGVKNLEKAIISSLVDVLDLAVRVQPAVTEQLLRSRIIPQAENLDLWTFLRLLVYTKDIDQKRLPMGALSLEAQFGARLHKKLLGMGRVRDICTYPKTIDIDHLISRTVYQSLTVDARAAYTEHIAFMLLDIHPWSQVPVQGTLDLAQELQRIINYHCGNSSEAVQIKFPKVERTIVGDR